MADSNLPITPGVGANVDTRTAPDGDHRQVVVLGDPVAAQTVSVGVNGGLSIKGTTIPGMSGSIAAGATGTVGPLAVDEAGNCTIYVKNQTSASPWAGSPVLVFEQSDDNVQWAAMAVVRSDTGQVASTFTLGAGAAASSLVFNAGLPGVNFIRVRVTTGPTTNGITITIVCGGLPFNPLVSLQQASRSQAVFSTATSVLTSATETALSLISTRANASVAAATAFTVPAGKMMRLQRLDAAYIATTTAGYGVLRLRINQAGAATTSSPIFRQVAVGAGTPATAGSTGMLTVDFGDGIDIWPGGGLMLTAQGYAAATATAVGYVNATLSGHEF